MPSLCSNRARVKPARRRSPIWVFSCSACTSRARAEPLGLVEFRDCRLALGTVLGNVGAFLGLAFLRLRSELAQALPAGLELGSLLVDDGADLREDRLDLQADVLQVRIRHGASLDRRFLLVEIRLEPVELGTGRLRFGGNRGRSGHGRGRGRSLGLSLRLGIGCGRSLLGIGNPAGGNAQQDRGGPQEPLHANTRHPTYLIAFPGIGTIRRLRT